MSDKNNLASIVADALREIKEELNRFSLEVQEIKTEMQSIKVGLRIYPQGLYSKVDSLSARVYQLNVSVKDLSPEKIISAKELGSPHLIDAEPQNDLDAVSAFARDAQEDLAKRIEAFREELSKSLAGRDPIQCLSDYFALLRTLKSEKNSKVQRISALKQRRKNSDKDSFEQKNAAFLLAKLKVEVKLLDAFIEFIVDCYFQKRKSIISVIRRTTCGIEEMFSETEKEYKTVIPEKGESSSIVSAAKELYEIAKRHEETSRANFLVRSGNMSALERRSYLAKLKTTPLT